MRRKTGRRIPQRRIVQAVMRACASTSIFLKPAATHCTTMKSCFVLIQLICCAQLIWSELECDPLSDVKKLDPSNPKSYFYCDLNGKYSTRKCPYGKVFNAVTSDCEPVMKSDLMSDDPFSQPLYQAPDDLCGSGIPLTILAAPLICNSKIGSCPDGYTCRMYERTGTSYCCQSLPSTTDEATCAHGLVTYIEPSGKPRSCDLSSSMSCPSGFKCIVVGGSITRCCGQNHGCPYNSAAFLHPNTRSLVECSLSRQSSCESGFSCVRSKTLHKPICCTTSSNSLDVCPAGIPLGGGPTVCSENNPCQDGHECVTTGNFQYCCPSKENVCSLPRNSGNNCDITRSTVTRYYFDVTTGSCRSFQFRLLFYTNIDRYVYS
ncbi:Kunitz/Bovine pancreatic trypsin inhibitor domain protein [Dictyocaulus viviparus]|uniref:Kunitz/Bovine pancreatic trypsin inhibitor domain protein n=1 Tax=Dictyocaulus viviparus TaxID=29172 RepID=A0A0D8XFJ4_DICVI|nr:Kunitz/Bovine pancreatic trypsin inhibitor domain protein [Dictyocaulus viviparus]